MGQMPLLIISSAPTDTPVAPFRQNVRPPVGPSLRVGVAQQRDCGAEFHARSCWAKLFGLLVPVRSGSGRHGAETHYPILDGLAALVGLKSLSESHIPSRNTRG